MEKEEVVDLVEVNSTDSVFICLTTNIIVSRWQGWLKSEEHGQDNEAADRHPGSLPHRGIPPGPQKYMPFLNSFEFEAGPGWFSQVNGNLLPEKDKLKKELKSVH